MKEVLFSWPFVDGADHEMLIATVEEKAGAMRERAQPIRHDV